VVPSVLLANGLWFGISPISAAVFGVPTGLLVTWLVSLATRPGKVAVVVPDGL
jgi:cation/acetate symporter